MSGALTQLTELSLYDTLRFHLVIERLFSSCLANRVFPVNPALVSISFSSGFSFQVAGVRVLQGSVCVFQSRYRAASHFRDPGCPKPPGHLPYVSISLSSGFSFQEGVNHRGRVGISAVSISLSSGFSFQVTVNIDEDWTDMFQSRYRAASHFRGEETASMLVESAELFQSRYRAASHFRKGEGNERMQSLEVSISLSSGFSFQA